MPADGSESTIGTEEPLARAVVAAIRAGDIDAMGRLLQEHPGLATARLGNLPEGCDPGMTRSLLHVVTDWPGHYPNGAAMVALLVEAGADLVLAGHIHQSTIAERREFEISTPGGERAVVVSIAPGFGQPRPNRRGEARGLHLYEIAPRALRILTYIWRDDGWALTAVRTFPRGREPLAFEGR